MTKENLKYNEIALAARKKVLELIYKAQTSHIGSNLGAIDLMTVLFEKVDIKKDEVILSAGWKAAAWYYFLWRKGIITEAELNSFCQKIICPMCRGSTLGSRPSIATGGSVDCFNCDGKGYIQSKFIGLIEPMGRWGLRVAGGSMGCGLPFAVGYALSKKMKGEEGTVYCLMSDGEMAIGTTWEAALLAAHHKLDNLVVIVDCNGFQAMGKTEDILKSDFPLGWNYVSIDGHFYESIENVINGKHRFINKGKPTPSVVMCRTIKGKGVSFMENDNLYHYAQLKEDDYQKALLCLNS